MDASCEHATDATAVDVNEKTLGESEGARPEV